MLYSQFVKEQMAKLKSKNMTAPEKMKHIGAEWRKLNGNEPKTVEKSMPKSEEDNDLLKMLGIESKIAKAKPKSKTALKKQLKAVDKMLEREPIEELKNVVSHKPLALKMKIDNVKEKLQENNDEYHGLGF